MKICLINNLYKPYNRGGAERVVEIVVEGLKKAGHEVTIVSTRPRRISKNHGIATPTPACRQGRARNDSYYPWNIISYYNLNKLPVVLRLPWHIINIFNIQSYFRIKKILQQEKFDLVMTHNLMGVGFLTSLAIRKLKLKQIHTLHDIQLLHPSGLMFVNKEKKVNSVFAKIYQFINKKLFGSPAVIISPSKWLLEMHKQKGFFSNSKCVVLRNPVATPVIASKQSERSNPDEIATSSQSAGTPRNDNFTFLYVGQIEKHKGVNVLVQAFKQLDNQNCELQIIGEGKEIQSLQQEKLDFSRIGLLGKKTPDEVKELMQQADCLVVPSLCYENCPTVILEAMSVGLPVIGSDIGGIPELLDDNLVFKAGNRDSLKNKMQWVIENKEKLTKNSEFKTKNLDINNYIDKILSL